MQFLGIADFSTLCQPKWIIVERAERDRKRDGAKCSFVCGTATGTVIRNIRWNERPRVGGSTGWPRVGHINHFRRLAIVNFGVKYCVSSCNG